MKNYIQRMTEAIPRVIELGQQAEYVAHKYALDFYGYHQSRGWRKFWHRFRLLIKLKNHGN